MAKYEKLSPELCDKIKYDIENNTKPNFAARGERAVRRNPLHDRASIWRPTYARDVDKILHSPYYNRYTDKTQVFSFFKNDDITRRALHVQLVSRIARSIGRVLNLDLDLIEAISLGHDIGHTPFGHAGERYISEVYHANTGRYFNHNVHSVRVLDGIFPLNLTLDTLDGILSHNGEFEMNEYYPKDMPDFESFDKLLESCYVDEANIPKIVPSTLEGCVVRVSDIIAYLGKDRQDAARAKLNLSDALGDEGIGTINAEIINNLVVNIIENSYGKPYIMLDREHYEGLREAKRRNYEYIYKMESVSGVLDNTVKPLMQNLYVKLLDDLKRGDTSSPIYRHHVDFVGKNHYASGSDPYLENDPDQIVVDYMASMTDDYCADLYEFLFPNSNVKIKYHGYFEDFNK